jgi:hypothetical protein
MGMKTVKSIDHDAATILATVVTTVEAPFTGKVAEVTYTAVAAVTGAASPASRTLSVINHGQAGAGTTVVASLALVSGVNLVAFDEKAVTLSVTAADLLVTAGDVLEFRSAAVGGTGLVDPGGSVSVTFERND